MKKDKEDNQYNFEGKLFPRKKDIQKKDTIKSEKVQKKNMQEFIVEWQMGKI